MPIAPLPPYHVQPPVCTIPFCGRANYQRGFCIRCYRRWEVYGDAQHEPLPRPPGPGLEYVRSVVRSTPWPSECIDWPFGRLKKDGRGYTVWEKKRVLVPRLVLYLVEGEWPDHACHTCHRPPCLNPNHLYNGTAESNARDRVESGRHVNSRQRLSDDDVDAIRAARLAGESIVSLGLKYGVNSGTISRAARGISVQARGLVAPVPAWMKAMPVYPDRRGSRNQAAKVTGEMVRKVRHLAATGERQVRIAADVGISQSAVSAIVNRKTWAHVA